MIRVNVQVVRTNERMVHDFDDTAEGIDFAARLLNKPVKTIRRGIWNGTLCKSYTASRSGLFVRTEYKD